MSEILEAAMVVCFGISWPINIHKLYRTRSTKGVSVLFYEIIFIGYLFGLTSKGIKAARHIPTPWYIWLIYSLNTVLVGVGILLYFRNRRIETSADRETAA